MNLNPIRANMTELVLGNGVEVLFSYRTPVAARVPELGYVKTEKKWSNTTTRHINEWLEGRVNVTTRPQDFFDGLVK